MLVALLLILVVLWFLGYGPSLAFLPPLTFPLFVINGHTITLWDILIFAVILWVLGILPKPFREIGIVIFLLWVLSTLGVFFFTGFASLLVIIFIVGIAASFIF